MKTVENAGYLTQQLITYLGNKRSLLAKILDVVEQVKTRLGKEKLRSFDVFSGSGVVSRALKAHSSLVVCNDLELYAAIAGRCYLTNRSDVDLPQLAEIIADLNARVLTEPLPRGFIEELYAPADAENITRDDRVFYTPENARRLDNYRRLIDTTPAELRDLLLAPLLSEASVHANTSGVFKGFHKNKKTKVGQFGGSGKDALLRILGEIVLAVPVLSDYECESRVLQGDANVVAREVRTMDLAYIDPPYNQHPYGSNYFMLNLVASYERPSQVSKVSGIPTDWQRSGYNVKAKSLELFTDLVENIDASHLLISFNDEGFISPAEMDAMLGRVGQVDRIEIPYNAFRGSRSFANRPIHVKELLFLVERG